MSKRYKVVFFIAAVIIMIMIIPRLVWVLKPSKPLNILVVNKTVPDRKRIEHRALFRVLVNEKFANSQLRIYNYRKDYYGFFPENFGKSNRKDNRSIRLVEIDSLVGSYDIAYFVDTYGVQYSDWEINSPPDLPNLIYGGLNQTDYSFLLAMRKAGKPLILEYNLFAPPTSELIKYKTEELFNIYWSGWKGKYFGSLVAGKKGGDVPAWMVNDWELQNESDWPFSKPGIILINSTGKLVVLEKDTHLDVEIPLIDASVIHHPWLDPEKLLYFTSWFDITFSRDSNEILSWFEIHTNNQGSSLLRQNRLPNRFPAVIRSKTGSPFIYFCGNFSRLNISVNGAKKWGDGNPNKFIPEPKEINDRQFFWNYYSPLMKSLLDEFYQN